MSDIWSGINLPSGSDEWVFKVGPEIRGPLPKEAIVDRLMRGDITLDTPVGREGTELHPISRVAAFAPHLKEAQKRANQRASRKRLQLLMLIAVPILLGASGAGYFVYQGIEQARVEQAAKDRRAREEYEARQKALANQPKLGLVALVSLGTEDDVKFRSDKSAKKPKKRGVGGKPAPAEEMVVSCQLGPSDIFGTLKKNLGKVNICVEDEKKRDASGLPPSLELEFVVLPSGRVVDFRVNDRHYRTGPMNNCMVKAFNTISFPRSNGSNCPVTIPIKIGG